MMPDLGKYAASVLSAYGVSLTLIALLILYVWVRARRARQALQEAENG